MPRPFRPSSLSPTGLRCVRELRTRVSISGRWQSLAVVAIAFACGVAAGGSTVTAIVRAEDLLEAGWEVRKVAEGCRFTEGPAVDAQGNLFFSDGHVEYKKTIRTSSYDFGLVDANGQDSLWQPSEPHSRAPYYYLPLGTKP